MDSLADEVASRVVGFSIGSCICALMESLECLRVCVGKRGMVDDTGRCVRSDV